MQSGDRSRGAVLPLSFSLVPAIRTFRIGKYSFMCRFILPTYSVHTFIFRAYVRGPKFDTIIKFHLAETLLTQSLLQFTYIDGK